MSKKSKHLRSQVDDSFVGGGHQIVKARERKRIVPDWVNDQTKVRALLIRAFPKLQKNLLQRERAARWARVIQLYFRTRYTQSQVAEEMKLTLPQVEGIIRSIQRVSIGRRADGTKMLGGKNGRPKRHAAIS